MVISMRIRKTLDGIATVALPAYFGMKTGYNAIERHRLKAAGAGLMLGFLANFGLNEGIDRLIDKRPTYTAQHIVSNTIIPPYGKLLYEVVKR